MFLTNQHTDEFYWIGLTDEKTEGQFVWSTNGFKAEYTNWKIDEPDGGMLEDCVHLNNDTGRNWIDRSCFDSGLFALCERGF
jgi:hypothetical protein